MTLEIESAESSLFSMKSNKNPIMQAVYLSKANLLATTSHGYDYGVKLWDLAAGIQVEEITVPQNTDNLFITCICYSHSRNYLIISYEKGYLGIYSLDSKKFVAFEKIAEKDNISTIAFLEEKQAIVVVLKEEESLVNFISFYPIDTLEKGSTVELSLGFVRCMKVFYHQGNEILVIGTTAGNILVKYSSNINIASKELTAEGRLKEFNSDFKIPHENELSIRDFTYRDDKLVSVAEDCSVIVWSLTEQNMLFNTALEDTVHCCTWVSDSIIAVSGNERRISFLSLDSFEEPICTFEMHTREVNYLEWIGGKLVSASYDKDIVLTEVFIKEGAVETGQYKIVNGHTAAVKATQLDYAKGRLVTVSTDKSIRIWDLMLMRLEHSIKFTDKKEYFDDFALLNDDLDTLVKVALTKKIKFYSLKLRKFVHEITEESPARCLINLFDGLSFLVGLSNGKIAFYKYRTSSEGNQYKRMSYLNHAPEGQEPSKIKITCLVLLDYEQSLVASGASNGSAVVHEIGNEENPDTRHYLAPIENSPIVSMCKLKLSEEENTICYLHLNENLVVQDFKSFKVVSHYDMGNVSSIDRVNDSILIVGFSNQQKISFYNPHLKQFIKEIEVTYSLSRPVFYLRDGKRIVCANGRSSENFSVDVVKLN